MLIRKPELSELESLSALCRRSKGYWGYDDAFLAACAEDLTLVPGDFGHAFGVAEIDGAHAGVALVEVTGEEAELLVLFVDPPFIGQGVGARLFAWAVGAARERGALWLKIEADPNAVPFYLSQGAVEKAMKPSQIFPGRMLPMLELDLT